MDARHHRNRVSRFISDYELNLSLRRGLGGAVRYLSADDDVDDNDDAVDVGDLSARAGSKRSDGAAAAGAGADTGGVGID